MPMSRGSQARIRPVRPGCNRSDSGTTLAPRPGPFLGDASLFFAPVLTRALTSKTCRRALGGQQALGLYVVMRQMNPTAIVAVPAPSAHLLPRRPRRRQRTAKPLRRCRQAARAHLKGSEGRAENCVERGAPGATRFTGTEPSQGISG
jgi:hypothetical protein